MLPKEEMKIQKAKLFKQPNPSSKILSSFIFYITPQHSHHITTQPNKKQSIFSKRSNVTCNFLLASRGKQACD